LNYYKELSRIEWEKNLTWIEKDLNSERFEGKRNGFPGAIN
jgi:hypothetical protein